MPLISVNARVGQVTGRDWATPLGLQLHAALSASPPEVPVVVMVHGFRFSPDLPFTDPHSHILALEPRPDCWRAISWPRHLGFGRSPDEGLVLGFGWRACGTIWQANAEAGRAGIALAGLLRQIRAIDPGRQINVLAHSLGARVVLAALHDLPSRSIGRLVLMAGAEFASRATAAMASPAGRTAEVFNVTTRENDLFDFLTELLLPAPCPADRALGHGLPQPQPNWLDLQIDQAETLAALAALGHHIAPPHLRICHWSAYLRPGLFGLYRSLLSDHQTLPMALLRQQLPRRTEPRWSRLLAPPGRRQPVTFAGKVPS